MLLPVNYFRSIKDVWLDFKYASVCCIVTGSSYKKVILRMIIKPLSLEKPCQTSKMKRFTKIVNKQLTNSAKNSILDV